MQITGIYFIYVQSVNLLLLVEKYARNYILIMHLYILEIDLLIIEKNVVLLLQLYNAVFYILTVKPSAPVGPIKFSDINKTTVTLSWSPPESDGGSPLTGYYIEQQESGKYTFTKTGTTMADITTYCVQRLKEKQEYVFKVYAENKVGRSEALESKTVIVKSAFGKL